MNDDNAISARNLTKIYKLYNSPMDRLKEALNPIRRKYHHDFHALQDVNFEVKKGEMVGIIGKNGSGKSTLLKLITGVLTPTSGCVEVNGRISALLELGAGFNPELTGVENVYFNGTLMGYSKEEMDNKLDSILSFADIGEFVNQPVKAYSSGMFVRLAFAVAINVKPEILIVDEALSVGDALFRSKCLTVIDRFRKQGVTVLYVTHEIASIKSLCSRAIYLVKGHVAALGKAGEIADRYMKELREEEAAAEFGHSCSDNLNTIDIEEKKDVLISTVDEKFKPTFKIDSNFDKQNASLRYGSGEARLTGIEILNSKYEAITHCNYNDKIKILIYLVCNVACTFSVGYNIRDAENVNMIGSNLRIEGVDPIKASPNEKYIFEFETLLPLAAGNYNISILVTEPIILNKTAKFIDVVENALNITVLERPIAKLWTKVYVENRLNITKSL